MKREKSANGSPQFKGGCANAYGNARSENHRSVQTLLVDHSAVGGTQVFDGPLAGGGIRIDARMVGRDEFVVQNHGVRSGTAKRDGVAGQRDGTAGKGAIDDDQQGGFGA